LASCLDGLDAGAVSWLNQSQQRLLPLMTTVMTQPWLAGRTKSISSAALKSLGVTLPVCHLQWLQQLLSLEQ